MGLLASTHASAQTSYITKADKPFDFASAQNFVVLYAPDKAVEAMGNNIISNNNLDPNTENNQFYYWTADWDKTLLVLTNVEEPDGKNSLGGSDYINMTPLYEWGGGTFQAKGSWRYDLSKVNDNMILHIGLRDFGSVAPRFKMAVGRMSNIEQNGFMLETNLGVGEENGSYMGVGSMGHDSQWYYLDIPVKDLVADDGVYGFSYDFSSPFNLGEGAVQLSFDKPQVSQATAILEPGNTVKTYTITQLGSAMSVDGIWFYERVNSGISTLPNVSAGDQTTVYDLNGRRMDSRSLQRGIYVVKTAQGVKKIAVE